MSDEYQFCEENASHLQKFLSAVTAQTESENKWRAYFAPPPLYDSPEIQPQIIEIHPSPADTSPAGEQTTVLEGIEDSSAKDLCELIESACKEENFSFAFEEVSSQCVKNGELFLYLAKNLSESAVNKFLTSVHDTFPDNVFLKQIFLKFFKPLIKFKDHTRFIDNVISQCFRDFPDMFNSTLLPVLLNEPQLSCDVFGNFVKSLTVSERKVILNEVFSLNFVGEQFLVHIPAILALYKTFEESFVKNSMIKMLCTNSEVGNSDKNFGKLLLAVIQSVDASSPHLNVLEGLCLVHQTILKKACLNALNKLKNT